MTQGKIKIEQESQANQYLFYAMGDAMYAEWPSDEYRDMWVKGVKEWKAKADLNEGVFPDGSTGTFFSKSGISPDSSDKVCPFCNEGDFDLPGLKAHLYFGWCLAYKNTDLS